MKLRKSKKILSVILAGVMALAAFTAVGISASAGSGTYGDFNYRINDDDTVTVLEYNGSDTEVTIPSEIDGKKVVEFTKTFFNTEHGREVKSVIIPEGITTIGAAAFMNTDSLENVTIPSTVTTIKGNAFAFTISLKDIVLPDSITEIEENAFMCSGLQHVKLPNGLETLQGLVFENCNNLVNLELPDSLKTIGSNSGCNSLTGIKIPATVTTIEKEAFGYRQGDKAFDVTIYGEKGSEAERYANSEGYKFVDLNDSALNSNEMIDSTTNIKLSGSVPENSQLKTRALDASEVPSSLRKNMVWAYDVSLDKDGQSVQPTGDIMVSIPCDNPYCRVFWFDEKGNIENANAVYFDGHYVFVANHLSTYGIIPTGAEIGNPSDEPSDEPSKEPTNEPSKTPVSNTDTPSNTSNGKTATTGKTAVDTGDNSNTMGIAAIFVVGALTAAVIIFRKNRTQY